MFRVDEMRPVLDPGPVEGIDQGQEVMRVHDMDPVRGHDLRELPHRGLIEPLYLGNVVEGNIQPFEIVQLFVAVEPGKGRSEQAAVKPLHDLVDQLFRSPHDIDLDDHEEDIDPAGGVVHG